jgi:hypothetical protein
MQHRHVHMRGLTCLAGYCWELGSREQSQSDREATEKTFLIPGAHTVFAEELPKQVGCAVLAAPPEALQDRCRPSVVLVLSFRATGTRTLHTAECSQQANPMSRVGGFVSESQLRARGQHVPDNPLMARCPLPPHPPSNDAHHAFRPIRVVPAYIGWARPKRTAVPVSVCKCAHAHACVFACM